jgi:cbb3-type cytochrome oxidase subunit 3
MQFMSSYKKIVFLISFSLIFLTIIFWIYQGAEIFTKTKVLVDNTSELDKELGIKNEIWVDKFVLGLDYTIGIIILIMILTFLTNYLLKTKRKGS